MFDVHVCCPELQLASPKTHHQPNTHKYDAEVLVCLLRESFMKLAWNTLPCTQNLYAYWTMCWILQY